MAAMSIDAPVQIPLPSESPASNRRSRLVSGATLLGFAIPAVVYLWMIHAYGVNVITNDQWSDVALIDHAHSGTLQFSTLWAQHNENRIFFPNLIVLALAYTTHFDVITEQYLSAFMLFGATTLVICAHKRRSPERRWIWYCPVAFLLLSLAQAGNALWGFQMAWYLVLLTTALALFLLDQEPLRWPLLGGAIAAAVIASFSSLQGLLVWPAGLLLIYLRRRSGHLAVTWIGAAVVTAAIYSVGFNFNTTRSPGAGPAALLTYFVRLVGDVVGVARPGALVTLFGTVLAVAAIWTLLRFTLGRRTDTGARPFALSLILFGLLFSAVITHGRGGYRASLSNSEPRYTVFVIFVLVGLYLAVLDPPVVSELRSSQPPSPTPGTVGQRQTSSDPVFVFARVVVGIGVVVTVIVGSADGISRAREGRQDGSFLGQVTVRADQYPDSVVQGLAIFERPQQIRRQITVARRDRLSLFGTGDAARYLSEKPLEFRIVPLRAAVVLPRNGSTVHGRQILDVLGSGSYDVTRVDYFLSGSGLAETLFATGRMSNLGWYTVWNTSKVPNGSYTIEASVRDSEGRGIMTPTIDVRVANGQPDRSARVADRVVWSSWASSIRVVVDYAQVIGRAETCPNPPDAPASSHRHRRRPAQPLLLDGVNGEPFSAVAGAESAPQLVGRASLDLATLGLQVQACASHGMPPSTEIVQDLH